MSFVSMASHVEHVKSLLRKISSSSTKERQSVLKKLSNSEIKLLCEVCLNLIHGHLKVKDQTTFNKLKRHRKFLSDLADKRKPIKRKRQLINQKGGFLATLAAAALPVVVDSLFRIFKK